MTSTNNRLQAPSGVHAHARITENARLLCCPALYLEEFATSAEAAA